MSRMRPPDLLQARREVTGNVYLQGSHPDHSLGHQPEGHLQPGGSGAAQEANGDQELPNHGQELLRNSEHRERRRGRAGGQGDRRELRPQRPDHQQAARQAGRQEGQRRGRQRGQDSEEGNTAGHVIRVGAIICVILECVNITFKQSPYYRMSSPSIR